jgi:hypothetical protein
MLLVPIGYVEKLLAIMRMKLTVDELGWKQNLQSEQRSVSFS